MKKHRESLNLAVERRATQHVKALEAGAEALEIAAAKRYSEGDKAGAESSLNSAKLVREEIKKLIVKGRRASLKLVK
jgi:hypothetical protein